ncbi:MAG: lysozyme inhibitor LprI family protein, partial [Pseudomonadota bacterium]
EVMDRQLASLSALAQDKDLRDRNDGNTPVWQRLVAEQRAWAAFRDARWQWNLPAPGEQAPSPEVARLMCLEHMTRARAQQLWDMSVFVATRDF